MKLDDLHMTKHGHKHRVVYNGCIRISSVEAPSMVDTSIDSVDALV